MTQDCKYRQRLLDRKLKNLKKLKNLFCLKIGFLISIKYLLINNLMNLLLNNEFYICFFTTFGNNFFL